VISPTRIVTLSYDGNIVYAIEIKRNGSPLGIGFASSGDAASLALLSTAEIDQGVPFTFNVSGFFCLDVNTGGLLEVARMRRQVIKANVRCGENLLCLRRITEMAPITNDRTMVWFKPTDAGDYSDRSQVLSDCDEHLYVEAEKKFRITRLKKGSLCR